ncbi:MAG: sulfurtransferase complex subunit TusB [Burkholderiales bacterium]|nr:sulfurtransferase complex subunit TusB [Burkholderiales bacterium]
MLHIVNKSPFEKTTLASCLAHAGPGAAVLLIEDGVYGATKGNAVEDAVRGALGRTAVYALAPDLEARGMKDRVIEGVKTVDYEGFVDLVAEHKTSQSWL